MKDVTLNLNTSTTFFSIEVDIEESPPKSQHLVIDEDRENVDRICLKDKWEIKESY